MMRSAPLLWMLWPRSAARWVVPGSRLCASPTQPLGTRIVAVASLAKLDVDAAAERAAEILAQPASPGRDLTPILAAFLHNQRGADVLAAAIGRHTPPADSAKLALRAVYALGRSDPTLVAALSRAAGLSSETKPLTPGELSQLVVRGRLPRRPRTR